MKSYQIWALVYSIPSLQATTLFVLSFLLFGFVHSGLIAPHAAAVPAVPLAVDTQYDPAPQYTFAYDIQDSLTGDSKSQQESRDGDVVKGPDL